MTYEAHGLKCTVCSVWGEGLVCFHHLHHRGSMGTDHPKNLMPLCQKHHNEVHQLALTRFSAKYPPAKEWLLNNGWHVNGFGKWRGPDECYTADRLAKQWDKPDYAKRKREREKMYYHRRKLNAETATD
jgi:hypothetical protein